MATFNPGSVRLRSLTIAGIQYDPVAVRELSITESLMRSFQTLEMIILDYNNNLNRFSGSGVEGGEDVNLIFDEANSGRIYSTKLKLHSIGQQQNLPGARAQAYMINAVGYTYYGNKVGGKVQRSFRNITGSDAIKKIHDEYLRATDATFEVDPSRGFLGEIEPYMVSNQTPFEAIHTIRTRLTSDQYRTGAFCYYRDNTSYKLRQIEKMFAELAPQEVVTQDPTVGTSIADYRRIGRNLINYQSGTSFSGAGGFASPFTAFSADGRVHSNYFNFGESYNRGNQIDPSPATVSGRTRLTRGSTDTTVARQYNIFPGDPRLNRIDPIQDKSNEEFLYAATLMAGPSFTGQVMIDAGIRMTVGKGIFADLQAPIGAAGRATTDNSLKGNYLVVNLKHTLRFYNISPMGVTTFEAIRGGYNT